jgi:serine/threonine protein kinase
MEYMEGGELFDKIKQRKKPFTEAQVAKIMNQICNAVLHLHSLGIAHRGKF